MGNLFEGYREGAQDWNIYSFDNAGDLTPPSLLVSGTYTAVSGVVSLNYGINIVNLPSGTYTAVLPTGIEASNPFIYVKNIQLGTVTLSGAVAGAYTIDGAVTKSVGAYGTTTDRVHILNYSGAYVSGGPAVNYITL